MSDMEEDAKKEPVEVHLLPARQYLDQTVVPLLLAGLKELLKERPDEPTVFLGEFLIKYKHLSGLSVAKTNEALAALIENNAK